MDPQVWGKHYWFFLHTAALTYPHHPNAITKKRYYELITNFALFIPTEIIAKEFEHLIDVFPVAPYLDNRDSLVRWTHFIHNKINAKLEKPQISLEEFYHDYFELYKDKTPEYRRLKERLVYGGIVMSIFGIIYYFYE